MSQTRRYTVELLTQQLLTIELDASCHRSAEDIARYVQANHSYGEFSEYPVEITQVKVTELGEARS